MNIFYLSKDYQKSAELMCDKHVVKMILESAQMLCTAHHINTTIHDVNSLYKIVHKNHPSTIWARNTKEQYLWLYKHFCSLCDEYTFRYGKRHATDLKLREKLSILPLSFPETGFTPPPKCMPDIYKEGTTIRAYRKYYKFAKSHFAKYTKRPVPEFMQ